MEKIIAAFRFSFLFFCVLAPLADLFARVALNKFNIVHEAVMYSLLSVPESGIRFVYALELTLIGIISFLQALQFRWRRQPTRREDYAARVRLLVGFLLFAYGASLAFSLGHPIAAVGVASPGSWITRGLVIDLEPWLRRWIEPGYWAVAVSIFALSLTVTVPNLKNCWKWQISFLLLLVLLESALLNPHVYGLTEFLGYTLVPSVHFLMNQALVYCVYAAVVGADDANSIGHDYPHQFATRVLITTGSICVLFLFMIWRSTEQMAVKAEIETGAHYYSWFPENWSHGYIGKKVVPPFESELGEYRSDSRNVLQHHLDRAEESGLSFFIFDWWPERPFIGRRIRRNIPLVNWRSFRFALLYETLDLKSKAASPVPYEDANAIVLTRERTAAMQRHWEHVVKRFANHESYYRIGRKPVLFVYATRHVLGEVSRRITWARMHVRATTGQELYLVADEAFFNVLTNGRTKALMRRDGDPEWDRLIAFDAVTSYNPYDSTRTEHAGERGARKFIGDVAVMYQNYRSISSTAGITFIPGVLPGYNDRGVRLGADHFVLPRTLDDGSSFFSLMLHEAGLPKLDRYRPMLSVTSWNEWNEGTNIEPSSLSEGTIEDESEGGDFYVRGELHQGTACRELEILSDAVRGSRN